MVLFSNSLIDSTGNVGIISSGPDSVYYIPRSWKIDDSMFSSHLSPCGAPFINMV